MSDTDTSGVTDLPVLLESMRPALDEQPYAYCSIPREALEKLDFLPLCAFCESEGITVIVTQEQARAQGWPPDPAWARITLTVHSSLQAVGFLAAVTAALTRDGISVNPVSAYYHDHLFIPWERRRQAMETLVRLSRSASKGVRQSPQAGTSS